MQTVIPPCPRCGLTDRVKEEPRPSSVITWFRCERCGLTYYAPRRHIPGEHDMPPT